MMPPVWTEKVSHAQTSCHQCVYDLSFYFFPLGFGQFTTDDLDNALEFCTHLIYGYAGINAQTLQMVSLNPERDIGNRHFEEITDLKIKYPHVKFLLSLGGDKDHEDEPNKYLKLLEADNETQKAFIESVLYLLRSYKFDGLDAYQFPRIDYNAKEDAWKSLKKSQLFENLSETNKTIESHKEQFVELVENLRKAVQRHELLLGLTVLPNINASREFIFQKWSQIQSFRIYCSFLNRFLQCLCTD